MILRWRLILIGGVVLSALLIAAVLVIAFRFETERQQAVAYANFVNQTTRTLGDVVRGTVEEVTPTYMLIRVANPYGEGSYQLRAAINNTTVLGKEDVVVEDGMIVGTTPQTPATIADLVPGTRVAVLLVWYEGVLLARNILLGNPL